MIDPLDRLVAIEDIRRLKAGYFRCIDTKDWDGLALLLAPDIRFDLTTVNSVQHPSTGEWSPPFEDHTAVHVGRDLVLAMIRGTIERVITVHHGHLGEIDVLDANSATGIWAMEDVIRGVNPERPVRMHGYGHYHDRYGRSNGAWQISETRISRLLID